MDGKGLRQSVTCLNPVFRQLTDSANIVSGYHRRKSAILIRCLHGDLGVDVAPIGCRIKQLHRLRNDSGNISGDFYYFTQRDRDVARIHICDSRARGNVLTDQR